MNMAVIDKGEVIREVCGKLPNMQRACPQDVYNTKRTEQIVSHLWTVNGFLGQTGVSPTETMTDKAIHNGWRQHAENACHVC